MLCVDFAFVESVRVRRGEEGEGGEGEERNVDVGGYQIFGN